jgi:hypothetical protein
MRPTWLIALVFVGCGGARGSTSIEPEAVEVVPDRASEPSQPAAGVEPAPAREGCVVEARIPSEAALGSYPSIEVHASPPIEYAGGPNPPRLIIDVIKPDKQRTSAAVDLTYPPVCAFCLPAQGSSGCNHDCRYEPFVRGSFGIARGVELEGAYRIALSLENYACGLSGREGVLVVKPR